MEVGERVLYHGKVDGGRFTDAGPYSKHRGVCGQIGWNMPVKIPPMIVISIPAPSLQPVYVHPSHRTTVQLNDPHMK